MSRVPVQVPEVGLVATRVTLSGGWAARRRYSCSANCLIKDALNLFQLWSCKGIIK